MKRHLKKAREGKIKKFFSRTKIKYYFVFGTVLLVLFLSVFIFLKQISADITIPSVGINLLQNPGFENGITSWNPAPNGDGSTATIDTGFEGQGLKLQSGPSTNWQAATQNFAKNAIAPGYYYELSAKFKTTPEHTASIGIYIDDSSKLSISKSSTGNNDWQTLSTRFYLPLTDSAGASTLNRAFRVNLYGINGGTNHDPVYYDNASLVRIEPLASSSEWSASPGNDPSQPTTSYLFYLNITNPATGAKWYNVNDGNYDHWTDQPQGNISFSAPTGIYQGQVLLTLSAWSDKPENGGVLLKQYPDSLVLNYDYSIKTLTFTIQATDQGNGSILLKAVPPEGTSQTLLDQIQYYSWEYHTPTTIDSTTTWSYKYSNSSGADPELLVSFAQPGVEYIKVNASVASPLNPRSSVTTPSTPIVIEMPPENGNQLTILDGWSTNHFIATHPIPGDQRFSLMKDPITLYSDGNLNLPLNTRDGLQGINPEKIQIDLPVGISLNKGASSTYSIFDVTSSADSTLESGYHRYQLRRDSASWGWSNTAISLFPHFDSDSVIGQSNLHMRVRAFKDVNIARTDNWQSFGINCEAIPVIKLPKRLTTSYTWTVPSSISVNTGVYPDNTNFFSLYKKLGFNTVPIAGGDLYRQNNSMFTTPLERQTEAWQGLKFGPEYSPLYGGYWGLGYFFALNLDDYNTKYSLNLSDADIDAHIDGLDFNTAFGFSLTTEEIANEKTKWKNALHFYAQHNMVDIAYDGVFRTRDLADMTAKMEHSRPEYVFLDIEGFGTYSNWRNYVGDSLNAQSKKQGSETNAELAYRLTDEFLAVLSGAITSVSPTTKIAFYDAHAEYNTGYQNFPWPLLQKNNFIAQPSVYVTGRNIDGYSQLLRNNRAILPAHAELIPWITTGTYGELSPENIYDQVIHTFLNGATGFSVFDSDFTDDMADTLNMTKAIGLISPYEDIVMDGDLAYNDISNISNATVSAMKLDGKYLLAVTPKDKSQPVSFKINTGTANDYTLQDLRHFTATTGDNATFSFSGTLSESTVMRLVKTSEINLSVNPIRNFTYKTKATLSGVKSANVTKVLVNNVEATVDNNANTWTLEKDLALGFNTITIVSQDSNGETSSTTTRTIIRRKPADANNDGNIDKYDFGSLMSNWLKQESNNSADFNEDGSVNLTDFGIMMSSWGN